MNEFKLTRRQKRHLDTLPDERRQITIRGWEGSKASAIRQACYECSGHSTKEASLCKAEACPMYGVNPYIKRGSPDEPINPQTGP